MMIFSQKCLLKNENVSIFSKCFREKFHETENNHMNLNAFWIGQNIGHSFKKYLVREVVLEVLKLPYAVFSGTGGWGGG